MALPSKTYILKKKKKVLVRCCEPITFIFRFPVARYLRCTYNTRVMFVRCWVIYLLFLLLIDKVSLQAIGVVGGSVILPCSNQVKGLKPEEVNVFWRYKQSKVVFNIEKGSASIKKQDEMFKDRVESFPSEYVNGNFSIRLLNLMLTDAGQFLCGIADELKEYKVTLEVKAPPTTLPTTASTSSDKKNSTNKTQPERIVTFLIAVLELLVLQYIRD